MHNVEVKDGLCKVLAASENTFRNTIDAMKLQFAVLQASLVLEKVFRYF